MLSQYSPSNLARKRKIINVTTCIYILKKYHLLLFSSVLRLILEAVKYVILLKTVLPIDITVTILQMRKIEVEG